MAEFSHSSLPGTRSSTVAAHAPSAAHAQARPALARIGAGRGGDDHPHATHAHRMPDGNDALLDLHHVRRQLAYFVHAMRRRWRLVAKIVASTFAVSVLALLVMPKSYHVETKILAQRNVVLPMLANPRRALPAESDTPTRLATETVMSHDNLESIITQTNLLANWKEARAPLLRAKDWVQSLFFGPMSKRDQTDAMIGMLEHRMWVTPGEGTVAIGVTWPDPVQAHQIVLTAQQNFIDDRHTAEISTVEESIAILESHAARVHEEIKSVLEDMGTVRRATVAELPALGARPATPRSADPHVVELQSELSSVQRDIADLEQYRSRRLAELQSTLSLQRGTYGPSHPILEGTEQSIRALSAESPQLVQLRQRERALLGELRSLNAPAGPAAAPASSGYDPLITRAAIANMQKAQTDSVMEERQTYGRSRLKIAVDAYEDLLGRLEAARIELETTRAAFKYRYGIIVPPQIPKRPMSPKASRVLGGGLALGMALAVFAVLIAELTAGRLVEPWQLPRALELPLIGEITGP